MISVKALETEFLLTRPSRDVTAAPGTCVLSDRISTHTPLAGRDPTGQKIIFRGLDISTHTPLAGRDRLCVGCLSGLCISTHTPLAGRDLLTMRPRTI